MKPFFKLLILSIIITACGNDDSQSVDLNTLPCDDGLVIDDNSAINAAKALDVCEPINARFIRANGTLATHSSQIGLLPKFGNIVIPTKGESMLMLSTGSARDMTQPSNCGNTSCENADGVAAPSGFPQEITGCASANNINDDIGFEMTLLVPENAKGFSFDFMFFTFDYPQYVCSLFNDQFIVTLDSNPQGSINGNLAFDNDGNPIGANCNFINPNFSNVLAGTGFGSWGEAGTTGWVRTTAPVVAGQEITLRFIIWDTGDKALDSSVIIDNFNWTTNTTTVSSLAL
jgi:hypothetical protein